MKESEPLVRSESWFGKRAFFIRGSARASLYLRRREYAMARKDKAPSFSQIVELLRGQSFEIAPSSAASGAAPGAVQVSKYGIAAVIAPSGAGKGEGSAASLVVTPGVLMKGEIARLLDRG